MKKIAIILIFILMTSIILSSCKNESDLEKTLMKSSKFSYDLYLKIPLWKGNLVVNESLTFVEDENGKYICQLMYKPTKILTFTNADLKTDYIEGTDYIIDGRKIVLTENSSIPRFTYDEFYPSELTENSIEKVGGGYLLTTNAATMYKHQVVVSYRHNEKWKGPIPQYKGDLLPKTISKLENGEKLNLVVFGDSIAVGCDSSLIYNIEPKVPNWPLMLYSGLKQVYPNANINYKNVSEGGTGAGWGSVNTEKVSELSPDLCFIAFGMNDGSLGTNAETVLKLTQTIMNTILKKNPNCEFILVSTMLPNAMVYFQGSSLLKTHADFAASFLKLEKTGIAVMNVTEMSEYLLTLKDFKDITGNNTNHPNDFFARVYAQVAISVLYKEY